MVKVCSACGVDKPATEFYADKRAASGLYSRCRKCFNRLTYESNQRYRRAHPDKTRKWSQTKAAKMTDAQKRHELERLQQWNAAHPERKIERERRRTARKRNAEISDFTPEQWEALKAAHQFRCVYCGKKPHELTMDHLTPLVRGGNHTASNIVPACHACNEKKGTRLITEI